jgi:hypothetical protein
MGLSSSAVICAVVSLSQLATHGAPPLTTLSPMALGVFAVVAGFGLLAANARYPSHSVLPAAIGLDTCYRRHWQECLFCGHLTEGDL